MRPQTILMTVDGALLGHRGGWGVVIVARAQEWISLGACSAQSTDEIEFRAALQGLQLATRLELLPIRRSLRIVSDSRRLIQACSKKTMRLFCAADWKRLDQRQHIFTPKCLAMRQEIWSLTAGHTVVWHWTKRFSTAESIQADALARVARGVQSGTAVARSGLTLDQIRRSLSTSADPRSAPTAEPSPSEPRQYEVWPGAPNVFTRVRRSERNQDGTHR
jgi:ribonuclease HI